MEPDRHILALGGVAEDECQMLDAVEGRRIGDGARRSDRRLDRECRLAVDQAFARLAIGYEIGDRDELEPVLAGEFDDLRPALDGPVIVDELRDDARRVKPGESRSEERRVGEEWRGGGSAAC